MEWSLPGLTHNDLKWVGPIFGKSKMLVANQAKADTDFPVWLCLLNTHHKLNPRLNPIGIKLYKSFYTISNQTVWSYSYFKFNKTADCPQTHLMFSSDTNLHPQGMTITYCIPWEIFTTFKFWHLLQSTPNFDERPDVYSISSTCFTCDLLCPFTTKQSNSFWANLTKLIQNITKFNAQQKFPTMQYTGY